MTALSRYSRHPIFRSVSSVLALACAAAPAFGQVTNCNDSGPGSLRDAVANAANNASIGLSPALACSRITLTSGAIGTTLQNLSISGNSQTGFVIDGNASGSVFYSNNPAGGNLQLSNMTITNGRQYGGGCVYVRGNLTLDHVTVSHCVSPGTADFGNEAGGIRARYGNLTMTDSALIDNTDMWYDGGGGSIQGNAVITNSVISGNTVQSQATGRGHVKGAGLFIGGNLTMTGSTVSGNLLTSLSSNSAADGAGLYVVGDANLTNSIVSGNTIQAAGAIARGGGMYVSSAAGKVTAATFYYSTVSGNSVRSSTTGSASQIRGGGIYSGKFIQLNYSTIDSNRSGGEGGGIAAGSNAHLNVEQSTITGNIAAFQGGALFTSYSKNMLIVNSTIALNSTDSSGQCGGVYFANGGALTMHSTIIAGNHKYNSTLAQCDIGNGATAPTITGTSAHNLIQHSSVAVPADTLIADPQFFPLASNGGPTRTLGIPQNSPARQTGDNIFGFSIDQRGYPREAGGFADIGAFEWQFAGDGDTIFSNGFDALFN